MKFIGAIIKFFFFLAIASLFSYFLVVGFYKSIVSGSFWNITLEQFITLAQV